MSSGSWIISLTSSRVYVTWTSRIGQCTTSSPKNLLGSSTVAIIKHFNNNKKEPWRLTAPRRPYEWFTISKAYTWPKHWNSSFQNIFKASNRVSIWGFVVAGMRLPNPAFWYKLIFLEYIADFFAFLCKWFIWQDLIKCCN